MAKIPKLKEKTDLCAERDARDIAIYNEFHSTIAANAQQSRTKLVEYLMAKYGIYSRGTIYAAMNRVKDSMTRTDSKRIGGAV